MAGGAVADEHGAGGLVVGAGDVAVADEGDAGAGLADFGDHFRVALTVEHADHEVGDADFFGAGEVAQVFTDRGVDLHHTFGQAAADGDFFHVNVRRV